MDHTLGLFRVLNNENSKFFDVYIEEMYIFDNLYLKIIITLYNSLILSLNFVLPG